MVNNFECADCNNKFHSSKADLDEVRCPKCMSRSWIIVMDGSNPYIRDLAMKIKGVDMDKTQRARLEFALNTLSSLKTMLSNWFGEPTSFPFVDVAVRLASANLNISFQFNNQTSGRLPSIEVGISFVYFKLGSPMSIQLSKRTGSSMFDIMSYAVEAAIKVGWEKWNQASSGDDSSE